MDTRKIIHIDMDAFYASVEQRDNPELRGRPVAVGHSLGRGVVAAASYEARRFGVRSAMPSARALRLCPGLVFVTPRFDVYKRVSGQMHAIFHEYTDIIEPISLDEAFLDVTINKPGITLAVDIAREIKRKIRERLGLVASAGVSCNKFLAKIASDLRKPDGLCTIHPSQAMAVIGSLPVENFWGVGPVTAKKMHSLGIMTGCDLRRWSLDDLQKQFGRSGQIFYDFARGIDLRPVEPAWTRKSLGCEHTFDEDITTLQRFLIALDDLALELSMRIAKAGFSGITLTLKVKYSDFTVQSRSTTGHTNLTTRQEIYDAAAILGRSIELSEHPVRLIGLSVSNPAGSRQDQSHRKPIDPRQLLIDFDRDY